MPTGPGGLDANGVWQYGEDDTEALASDLLNLGMASISTEVGLLDAAVAAIVTGQILQVVSVTKTDTFSTTSTSLTDVTGFTATITPSSTSSKILVMTSCVIGSTAATGSRTVVLQLLRDSTQIFKGDTAGSRESGSAARPPYISARDLDSGNIQHLDSPSSTSPVTYKIQMKVSGATGTLGRSGEDGDSEAGTRVPSSITLMEVAG